MDEASKEMSIVGYFNLAIVAIIPCVLGAAWLSGNAVWLPLAISVLFACAGFLATRLGIEAAKPLTGVALVGQCIALTAALSGTPWQIDAHMTFFAALAVLVVLNDVRTILAGTAAIALHHLGFSIAVPSLVYPGTELLENLARTMFHAVVVLVEAAALSFAIRRQNRLRAEISEGVEAVTAASQAAEAARDAAKQAQRDAEKQRNLAVEAKGNAERALVALEEEKRQTIALHEAGKARDAREREAAETRRQQQEQIVVTLVDGLTRLSRGDLTARILNALPPEYEELRHDFNRATEALDTAINEVAVNAAQVLQEASGISGSANALSRRTEQQAATLEETAAAMEKLTELVQSTARNASQAATSSTNAKRDAEESGKVVAQASEAMRAISDSAGEVSKIIGVIDDIAFQTNLLALNAGVEAARAGDAGRGFAVVASEVRALAQRSSEAAKEINTLISKSDRQVTDGVRHVGETVNVLNRVTAAVSEISERVQQIANSAQEQADGLGEINTAVTRLDNVTQHNAAMFEETAAASSKLTEAAERMRSLTEHFTFGEADASGIRAA
ncbi:methyl-accepting chemotaxis protein [Roseivivax lentus]|uniref:Methyl-accepting chemotaxis protein n=1 Tax=Roseivivax lentus TaxID=633194 RepID=A0A1N7KYK4_9RHOB|nr:methyl-accepting chemotaxis protein [Roseivivax lentus]SIS66576.1 methyl-accepting chemotaxis protein [Roseivivax lentus]